MKGASLSAAHTGVEEGGQTGMLPAPGTSAAAAGSAVTTESLLFSAAAVSRGRLRWTAPSFPPRMLRLSAAFAARFRDAAPSYSSLSASSPDVPDAAARPPAMACSRQIRDGSGTIGASDR